MQKNIFSSSGKLFFRTCLDCFRDSILRPSRLRSYTLTITLQEPFLQGILLSDSLSLLWLQRAGFSMGCSCGKTIFQALKNCFFRTALMTRREAQLCKKKALKNVFFRAALMKLRQARLSNKKNQALRNHFFACLLSNLPTPPRYLV